MDEVWASPATRFTQLQKPQDSLWHRRLMIDAHPAALHHALWPLIPRWKHALFLGATQAQRGQKILVTWNQWEQSVAEDAARPKTVSNPKRCKVMIEAFTIYIVGLKVQYPEQTPNQSQVKAAFYETFHGDNMWCFHLQLWNPCICFCRICSFCNDCTVPKAGSLLLTLLRRTPIAPAHGVPWPGRWALPSLLFCRSVKKGFGYTSFLWWLALCQSFAAAQHRALAARNPFTGSARTKR